MVTAVIDTQENSDFSLGKTVSDCVGELVPGWTVQLWGHGVSTHSGPLVPSGQQQLDVQLVFRAAATYT